MSTRLHAPLPQPEPTLPPAPLPGATLALALLLLINLFNYIDRQLLVAVLPKIKKTLVAQDVTFASDPDWMKTKLGFLTSAFMVSFLLASPFFGWLAERRSRWYLMGLGVIVWSLASGASGLSSLFLMLLVTRCFVGIGEAAYGPVAPAMLSDLYPLHARSRIMGWFYLAVPIGTALGYLYGGLVADSSLGWKWAFYLVVPPGILLGLCCFAMPEPVRHAATRARLSDYLILLRTPSYVLNTLGMTAMMFAVGGVGSWMNSYLYERESWFEWNTEVVRTLEGKLPSEVLSRLGSLGEETFLKERTFEEALKERLTVAQLAQHKDEVLEAAEHGWKLRDINLMCGLMGITGGILGTLLGPIIADRMRKRFAGAYFQVSAVALLLGFPCFLLVLVTPLPWTWLFIFLTSLCLFISVGPTSAILANVSHPSMRATAFALNLFIIHALGDAISPAVVGVIADLFDLQVGFLVVSMILVLGGVLWLWGARYLQRDTELAPTRLNH